MPVSDHGYNCWGSQNDTFRIDSQTKQLQPPSTDMAQILDPLPFNNSASLLCCYVNATSKIQVARIADVPNWYFERVVFPGQRLVFEAPMTAHLEIHTGMMATAILSDTIPCDRLLVQEDLSVTFKQSPDSDASIPDAEKIAHVLEAATSS
jgi:Domain of unknown function (DUF1830)